MGNCKNTKSRTFDNKNCIEEQTESQSPAHLLPGMIKTGVSEELRDLNIVNCREEPLTIYPNTTLGTCISVKENNPTQITSRNTKTFMEQPSCEELPEYLNDHFLRSSVHLNEEEQSQLKSL